LTARGAAQQNFDLQVTGELEAVVSELLATPARIASKYFYDDAGQLCHSCKGMTSRQLLEKEENTPNA
jgi:uncharacterized SAM-dependent methyltransferase